MNDTADHQKNSGDQRLADDLSRINSRKERTANSRYKIQLVDERGKKESPHVITSAQRGAINGHYMQSRGTYDQGANQDKEHEPGPKAAGHKSLYYPPPKQSHDVPFCLGRRLRKTWKIKSQQQRTRVPDEEVGSPCAPVKRLLSVNLGCETSADPSQQSRKKKHSQASRHWNCWDN